MNQQVNVSHFDDSLPIFVNAIFNIVGAEVVTSGWVLRDSSGLLAFVSSKPLTEEEIERAVAAARAAIPRYCREDWVLVDADYPGMSTVIERSHVYVEKVEVQGTPLSIRMVDQRIVGADWLQPPAPSVISSQPPRYVFASLKGGVGRTTALAVVATDLAELGRKVLVIDMDLEAPGIGNMLLPADELPKFGLLDAYIESSLSNIDDDFLFDMVAPSPFGRGKGLIDVAPAVGQIAQGYPANVLAKLARAYVESVESDGKISNFTGKTRQLIESLAGLKKYDAVLIDARAGLNESTAAAILGLGAEVLLFGEDTPQTFAGYRYLLGHLARFPRDDDDDWLLRLKMVHAKASPQAARQQMFRDKAHTLFQEFLYQELPLDIHSVEADEVASIENSVSIPEFSIDDPEAPHYALAILRDSNYFEFDPLGVPNQLTQVVYEKTYQSILGRLNPARDFEDLRT